MSDFLDLNNKTAWIIVEPGLRGTENQCIALAERLRIGKFITKYVELRKPWRWFAPYVRISSDQAYKNGKDLFKPPWPDIIIASGRKSVIAALYIKKMSALNNNHGVFLIQIQNPKLPPDKFDLVIAPHHDGICGDNVVSSMGALHRITPAFLKSNRTPDFTKIEKMPRPRVAVLIGGTTKHNEFDLNQARNLATQLKDIQLQTQASMMVTTSRRTGHMQTRIIEDDLNDQNMHFWNGQGSNPYFDYLDLADYIIVTNDSVSMASEALATGKPVYIANIGEQSERIERYHHMLRDKNLTKPLGRTLEDWKRPAGDDMVEIISQVLKHYESYLNKQEEDHVKNNT